MSRSRGDRKAILFDAGNTLVHLDYALIARTFQAHGIDVSPAQVRRGEQRARVPIDRLIAGSGGAERNERSIMHAYFRFALEALQMPVIPEVDHAMEFLAQKTREGRLWTVVEPGTEALLADLTRRGYCVGVVSNSNGTVERFLEAAGLRKHLAVVIDSAVVGVEKPDPRIFALALERAGAAPADATYIGDLYHVDVGGARNAGLGAILLDPAGVWDGVDCPTASDIFAAASMIVQADP